MRHNGGAEKVELFADRTEVRTPLKVMCRDSLWCGRAVLQMRRQSRRLQGVIATVKHFAANNEEYSRHDTSADVDERTLREIYLPSFEAAVAKAQVDAVMNFYNLINNVPATENEFLNRKVLKDEWGFQGIRPIGIRPTTASEQPTTGSIWRCRVGVS